MTLETGLKEVSTLLRRLSRDPEYKEKRKKTAAWEESEYLRAYCFYDKGHYMEAAESFRKLALINGLEKNYWFGLGASEQLAKNYQAALSAWSVAALLDPMNAYPHFHAAECFLSEENVNEAFLALDEAKKRSSENELLEKIAALQEIWQNPYIEVEDGDQ